MHDIKKKAIYSAFWKFFARVFAGVIIFGRGILFARLLEVKDFGIYAYAATIIEIAFIHTAGVNDAFINKVEETQDEDLAAANHFTLMLLINILVCIVMMVVALLFSSGETQITVMVLLLLLVLDRMSHTPVTLLKRKLEMLPLAQLDVIEAIFATILAVTLAYYGFGVWALVATVASRASVSFVFLFYYRKVWKIRIAWTSQIMRYYISYAIRTYGLSVLSRLSVRLDNLVAKLFYGPVALGYYSSAQRVAQHPEILIFYSIQGVIHSFYSSLKDDRQLLSKGFVESTSFLVRFTLLIMGGIYLVTPTFFVLVLGSKWAPCLEIVPYVLGFTIIRIFGQNFVVLHKTAGAPEEIIPWKALQILVVISFMAWNFELGIKGIAIAVLAGYLVFFTIISIKSRKYVDYNWWKIFGTPVVIFIVAMTTAMSFAQEKISWQNNLLQEVVFTPIYIGGLFILERERFMGYIKDTYNVIRKKV